MSRPAAPRTSPTLLSPGGEYHRRVKALVVLVLECPAHHLEDLLYGLPYEGVVDRCSVAQQQGRCLPTEILIRDYGPGGRRGGTGYSCFVHKHLLMGRASGGFQPRRGFQLLAEMIILAFW